MAYVILHQVVTVYMWIFCSWWEFARDWVIRMSPIMFCKVRKEYSIVCYLDIFIQRSQILDWKQPAFLVAGVGVAQPLRMQTPL